MNVRGYLMPAKYKLRLGARKLQCYLCFLHSLVVRGVIYQNNWKNDSMGKMEIVQRFYRTFSHTQKRA